MESPEFNIDESSLCYLDWSNIRQTCIEQAALNSIQFCKAYLNRKETLRDARKELAKIVLLYLTGSTDWKIKNAGVLHHAIKIS